MKKSYIVLIFAFIMVLFTPSFVHARGAIATATAPGLTPNAEPMGKIVLYDDYKIAFHYGYRVNNIVIEVAKDSVAKNLKEAENQTFTGNTVVEFDLNPLMTHEENESSEYTIKASASFRQTEGLGFESVASLNTKVTVSPLSASTNYGDKILQSSNKALTFINDFVIQGIYIVLAAVLVVKGVILALDIVKNSDAPDVRREKIRAFAYMFLGIVCVAVINTCIGVMTGLF